MSCCFLFKMWFASPDVRMDRLILEELGIIVKSLEHFPGHLTSGLSTEMQVRIETGQGFTATEIVRRLSGMDRAYNNDRNRVAFAYNLLVEDRSEHILEEYGIEIVSEAGDDEEVELPRKRRRPSDEFARVGMQVCGLNRVVRRVASSLASEVVEAVRQMERAPAEVARMEEENRRLKEATADMVRLRAELEGLRREKDDYILECSQTRERADALAKALEEQRRLTERALAQS